MTAGIYKLVFDDGTYYIGKSRDIDQRLDQHIRNMEKGTHSKRVQAAYDRCGEPRYTILHACSEDHLDILESYYIILQWSDDILNGNIPIEYTELGLKAIENIPKHMWEKDTIDIINANLTQSAALDALHRKIKDIKSGRLVKLLEDENKYLRQEMIQLKNRGFFDRLFNT